MPAEWEAQEAVWLSWPHVAGTWPGRFRYIPAKFAEIAAHISHFEKVRINAPRTLRRRARALLEQAGADSANVEFYPHATDDSWCRDHGPIFVKNDRTGEVALTDWKFNTWGGKYPPYRRDNEIPPKIGRALGLRRFEIDLVLEGGSIDVNGSGLLLTTESCLLNRNRNPQLDRGQIEQALKDNLGVGRVLWLGEGIAGDDTDGHVDDLSRFFRVDGVVTSIERDPRDVNFRALHDNRQRLDDWHTPAGRRFEIIELPMPKPCHGKKGRLPASYTNFLVLNNAVLLPGFRQPRRDAEAAEVLRACFPDRTIIPVDCLDLVHGLGTLHCVSQQQPA
ncbi:MAG: agmatine deiminase [Verrucomicrobia bacterium RIFCSPLOWO2_12_FULL_64_8]|nr:MAG: agmatine deiminase [Verrucomicrobia bacterium RIFCSPLOWO2_12_FULL_64_8]